MNIFAAGTAFEFDWMAYLQSQGFFVRRALPIVAGDEEDATDIDVWGIRFLPPLLPSIAVADLKDKQKPKTYERILWTKGLAGYLGADQGFVGIPKANASAIDLGRRAGVHVLPHRLIKDHLESPSRGRGPFGQAIPDLHADFFWKRRGIVKAHAGISEQLTAARSLYIGGQPLTNVNRAIEGLRESARAYGLVEGDPDRAPLWLYACCEFITAFALNLLRAAEAVFALSDSDRQAAVLRQLTYGDLPPGKLEEIVMASYRLATEQMRAVVRPEHRGMVAEPPPEIQKFSPPSYATSVHGLLERVIQGPRLYWSAMLLLEDVLFGCALHAKIEGKKDTPRYVPDPRRLGDFAQTRRFAEVMKATKNYISVICQAAEVSRRPFWVESIDETAETTKPEDKGGPAQLTLPES